MARKESTVIPGSTARNATSVQTIAPPRAKRSHRNRRRIIAIFSLVVLIAISAIGYQAWKIVDAIFEAEQAGVIAWPTREPSLAQIAIPTSTPTENDPSTATATSAPVSTPTARATSAIVFPTATAPINVVVTPTATAAPTQPPADPPVSTEAAPTATPTPPLAQGSGDTSHFSVVKDILGAGTDGGDPGLAEVWGGRTSLNILVVGVDRRADGGDQNADVLIIAHVDLITKQVAAVSLPRDLLVEIPGVGPDKINGSYNYGVLAKPDDPVAGIAKVRDTIESVFGVVLDGYVLIDFNGFTDVVDSVGGVDVDVPYEIIDEEYPTEDYGTEVVTFEPGIQHMDGETALKYVRTRHADSDDARRERQYQVLLALFDTGKSLSSVTKADELIVALGKSVQTSFPLEQQLLLARVGLQVERSEIRLSVLGPPLLESGYTEDGKWVYTGDLETIVGFVRDALIIEPAAQSAGNSSSDVSGS